MIQRFDLTRSLARRGRSAVVVEDDVVRFEHPLLTLPVAVSRDEIAAVVFPAEESVSPLLVRDPRQLNLVSSTARAPNAFLVVRSPVRFEGFKRGAARLFRIARAERRRGVDVDIVGVAVADGAGLAAAMAGIGVPVSASMGETLRMVVGEATGAELEHRLQVVARRTRQRRVRAAVGGAAVAAGLSARLSLVPGSEPTLEDGARMAAVAIAGAVALGCVAAMAWGRPLRSRRLRTLGSVAIAVLALGLLVHLVASIGNWVGTPYVLAHAAAGALAGLWWFSAALVSPGFETRARGDSADLVRTRRHVRAWVALPGVAAVTIIAVVAILEPGSTRDLSIARAAVITTEDLPTGWGACCGTGRYWGSSLEQHICGSDPDDLPGHTAGFDREFSLNLRHGLEDGHLVEAVFLAPTTAAARDELAAVDSQGYGPCAMASVARSARISVPGAVGEPISASYERRQPPGDVEGVVDRFETVFRTESGTDSVFTTFVRLRIGRAIVRMPIMTYDGPLSDAELRPIADVAVAKLRAALENSG